MALPTCESSSLCTLLGGRLSSEYLSQLREENAKRAERPFRSIRDTAEGERAEHGLCHRTLLPWPEKLTLGLVTILVKYLINL